MEPLHVEKAAVVAVGIEIDDGVLLEFVGMLLDPFGRAEKAGLFTIPRAIDDRALGAPALLPQFAESAGFFEQGRLAGERILGAVDPRVVMIAANHPLIGLRQSREAWR